MFEFYEYPFYKPPDSKFFFHPQWPWSAPPTTMKFFNSISLKWWISSTNPVERVPFENLTTRKLRKTPKRLPCWLNPWGPAKVPLGIEVPWTIVKSHQQSWVMSAMFIFVGFNTTSNQKISNVHYIVKMDYFQCTIVGGQTKKHVKTTSKFIDVHQFLGCGRGVPMALNHPPPRWAIYHWLVLRIMMDHLKTSKIPSVKSALSLQVLNEMHYL